LADNGRIERIEAAQLAHVRFDRPVLVRLVNIPLGRQLKTDAPTAIVPVRRTITEQTRMTELVIVPAADPYPAESVDPDRRVSMCRRKGMGVSWIGNRAGYADLTADAFGALEGGRSADGDGFGARPGACILGRGVGGGRIV
jgi:hypothetical protein